MKVDELLVKISDYVHDFNVTSSLALKTAHLALLDSMGCALLAQKDPACVKFLGPIVPETKVPLGARVPGTQFELDPVKAAFDIGTCIRWLDYNDTWLALEWGHPSDNLGSILAVSDFISRLAESQGKAPIKIRTILDLMIKAYEIQGVLALGNAFNRVGLDHVILVKLASAAVISKLFRFTKEETLATLSLVFMDNGVLRLYRHAPNVGPRKSWAAGDATSRAVYLAWMVQQGESGSKTPLSVKPWGFNEIVFRGKPVQLTQPLGCYVMENILFKVAYPAEFHAQTAIECAVQLYPEVQNKWENIEKIEVTTQEPALRIICKEGPLNNYADRDHCLQYIIAIGLLFGELKSDHYSNAASKDPRIDILRSKMVVKEDKDFSDGYLDPEKRSIGNAVQVFFKDGTKTKKVIIEYPLGHKRRREEAKPLLKEKYNAAINSSFKGEKKDILMHWWNAPEEFLDLSITEFMETFSSLKAFV